MSKSAAVIRCENALVDSILDDAYGDIRSILDELLPNPTWDEQVEMTKHLALHVNGALFEYDGLIGWSYVEEGE